MAHNLNMHYFDTIDNEHKAYWLGFIWSDGYLGYRIRDNGREEYNLKLSLMENDYKHLEKFNKDLDGDYQIHYYTYGQSAFRSQTGREARLFITNKYLGKLLRDTYGIIPYRDDCSKLIQNIPEHLIAHFIRGIIDADGCFCHYHTQEEGYTLNKYTLTICGTISLLQYIEKYLVSRNLIQNVERKYLKRHKESNRDVRCSTLNLSGKHNVVDVLNYLYKDATIYLDRKYEKYLKILEGTS